MGTVAKSNISSSINMAPKIKLIYFDARGRAELNRIMLNYGGIEFEDFHIQHGDWEQTKPTLKFGFLPEIEWDGVRIAQSVAIYRLVAKEVGIAGKNNVEMAQCDAVVDFCSEMAEASVPCAPFSPDGDEKKQALEKFKTKLDSFIKNIEKILEENGGQWMVGKEFTWADLYVAYVLNQYIGGFAGVEWKDKTPKLLAHQTKVFNIPKIKAYLDKRPHTEY